MLLMSIWAILCFNKNGDSIHGIRAFQNPDHPTVLWKKHQSQFPYSLYCTDGLFRMGYHTPIWGSLVVFLMWMRTTARCVGVMLLVSSLYRTNHALLYFVMSLHPVMNDEVLLPKGINSFLIFPFTILSAQESKKLRWQSYFLKRTGQKKTQRR